MIPMKFSWTNIKKIYYLCLMEKIKVHDKTFRLAIKNEDIESSIDEVAVKLNAEYQGCEQPPILLCILTGAMAFTASLMQRLDFQIQLACMKVSSYEGTTSSGTIVTKIKPTADLTGRRVIICEDIVDTGTTIRFLRGNLLAMGAKDVKVCCMMFKPESLHRQLLLEGLITEESTEAEYARFHPEFYAMSIPNDFIVGYGLDYNELGRQYKDIYVLDE